MLTIRFAPETFFFIAFMILLWNVLVLYHVCHMRVDRQLRDVSLPRTYSNTFSSNYMSNFTSSAENIRKMDIDSHYHRNNRCSNSFCIYLLVHGLVGSSQIYHRKRIPECLFPQRADPFGNILPLQIFRSTLQIPGIKEEAFQGEYNINCLGYFSRNHGWAGILCR